MIHKLAQYFSEFPGIGDRQSKRFVYFLLSRDEQYIRDLIELISSLKKNILQCKSCYRFYPASTIRDQESKISYCDICTDSETDKSLLMIIEKNADLESIRKSGTYKGKFFILGNLVPIVEKNTEKKVRVKELLGAVQKQSKENNLKEIILAFSLNPQGEHTDMYIRKILSPLEIKRKFKISSLGRGLSTGTELEYSDDDTIKNALKNRS